MEQITKEDVEQIFFAISVASGEIGEDAFVDLSAKLYRLFPEVKAEHEQRERQLKYEADRQTQLRKELVEDCLKEINQEPYKGTVLAQLIEWFLANNETGKVRGHVSDEICFSFDLFKYADPKLVAKIIAECRTELNKGNEYNKDYAKKPDGEMVHGLIRILESASFDYRKNKEKFKADPKYRMKV